MSQSKVPHMLSVCMPETYKKETGSQERESGDIRLEVAINACNLHLYHL